MRDLFVILIILSRWKSIRSDQTSIHGLVLSERNESTPSLANSYLVLMIKNDDHHDDIHHLRLRIDQKSFPIQFNLTNIDQIQTTGNHLLTLLIFGYTHRLLWEGILFRQKLMINRPNNIIFLVKDVSNLPKCLSHGYPCLETSHPLNSLISMCCSDTNCQQSNSKQFTCGGNTPAVQNLTITYVLPMSIKPLSGPLDRSFADVTEKLYQSESEVGTIVKINNASILIQSNNRDDDHAGNIDHEFVLMLDLSIISSTSCEECLIKTRRSIQTQLIPFNIPQQDGSSFIVSIGNPSVNITAVREGRTTTRGTSTILIGSSSVLMTMNPTVTTTRGMSASTTRKMITTTILNGSSSVLMTTTPTVTTTTGMSASMIRKMILCISPYVLSSTGSCVNILLDINNCGSLGHSCSSNYTSCSAGVCSEAPSVQLINGNIIWTAGLNGSADDRAFGVTLPFNITLYTTTTNFVNVTTNGVLCLGNCSSTFKKELLSTSLFPGATAFPYWDDLYIRANTSQGMYYGTEGIAPNRTLIFEFYMSHFIESSNYYLFHVIFFESLPGVVQYKYFYVTDQDANCTVGVQASGAGPSIQYTFFSNNSVQSNMSLFFDTNRGIYVNSTF